MSSRLRPCTLLLAGSLLAGSVLTGCAAKLALRQGERHAAAGDWVQALEAFQQAAVERPDDSALKTRIAEAEDHAMDQLVVQAEQALAEDDFEQAYQHLQRAEAIQARDLRVALLMERVAGGMAEQVRALLAGSGDDPVQASCAAAQTFGERFPEHPLRDPLFEEIRQVLLEQADGDRAAGRFSRALVRLEQFQECLELSEDIDALRAAWAASLKRQAADAARRGQPASAWVCTALAAGVQGDEALRAERDRLRQRFLDRAGLALAPRLRGASERVRTLDAALAKAFPQGGAVRWDARARRPLVSGKLQLAPVVCAQTSEEGLAVHEFQTDVGERENPAWRAAKDEQSAAEAALREAETRREELAAQRGAVLRRLESAQAKLQPLRDAVTAAQGARSRQRAGAQEPRGAQAELLQRERQAEAALEQGLAALEEASSGGGDVAAAAQQVEQARSELEAARAALALAAKPSNMARELARHVEERAEAVAAAERLVQQAHKQTEATKAPLEKAEERVATLQAELAEQDAALELLEAERKPLEKALKRANDALEREPRTSEGAIMEQFRYPVLDWTRSCRVSAELALRGPGDARSDLLLERAAETSDSAHDAQEEHDIEADPLLFPESDEQLVAQAEGELAREIGKLLRELARGHLEQLRGQIEGADEETRLRVLLLSWLQDPEQSEGPLRDCLAERWGVSELEWLR